MTLKVFPMKCSRPLLAILGALAAAPALGHGDHADATLPDATLPGVARNALIEAPEIVDCTLEDGTETSCYSLTVGYLPDGLEIGPFCPATLSDDGGIWDWSGENARLYRIDEAFLRMLDGLGYRFFDDDGTVHTVDNAVKRPQVDHACINVSEDADVTITMLIPVEPVMAETPSLLGVVNKV